MSPASFHETLKFERSSVRFLKIVRKILVDFSLKSSILKPFECNNFVPRLSCRRRKLCRPKHPGRDLKIRRNCIFSSSWTLILYFATVLANQLEDGKGFQKLFKAIYSFKGKKQKKMIKQHDAIFCRLTQYQKFTPSPNRLHLSRKVKQKTK